MHVASDFRHQLLFRDACTCTVLVSWWAVQTGPHLQPRPTETYRWRDWCKEKPWWTYIGWGSTYIRLLCDFPNFFFYKKKQTQECALLRLLMLGLSGRFWLHASLLRFREIGFLRPWQSLALPLAVILQLLSLMEAGMVNSIHYVPPSAAGPHREHNKCPKLTSDAPPAPQDKPDAKNTPPAGGGWDTDEKLYLCSVGGFYNLQTWI